MNEHWNEYTVKGGQKLRLGYTTGSCAAAASKAAAVMLLRGRAVSHVRLRTPGGPELLLEVEDIRFHRYAAAETVSGGISCLMQDGSSENPGTSMHTNLKSVSCAVRKDSGDDPDVTNGALVYAEVAFSPVPGIRIEGGEGIGRVTKPGLDQPVGAAAINSTPRRMIAEAVTDAVREAAAEIPAGSGFIVTVSVPAGRQLAEKTFNPKLGIVGGISILGTTGIVDPMSDEALLSTIRTEIRVRRCEGLPVLPAAPGNYGKAFFLQKYGFSLDTAVTTSNFIRDTVEMAAEAGFSKMLFVGHIGKLVKVAGGIPNTHSKYGDHRMEILTELAGECLFTPGPAREKGAGMEPVSEKRADMEPVSEKRAGMEPVSEKRAGMEPVSENRADRGSTQENRPDSRRMPTHFFDDTSEPGRFHAELAAALKDCVSTDEAVRILRAFEMDRPVLARMTCRIKNVMEAWSGGKMQVEVIVFSNVHGELGKTEGAEQFLRLIKNKTDVSFEVDSCGSS